MSITEKTLSGFCDDVWLMAIDPDNTGKKEKWHESRPDNVIAGPVPGYAIEAADPSPVVWYFYNFHAPEMKAGQRVIIKFGGVSYFCELWLNGTSLGSHEGSEKNFEFDLTEQLKESNVLSMRVVSPISNISDAGSIEGFDYYETPLYGTFYPLILERPRLLLKPEVRIEDVFADPDCETGFINYELSLLNQSGKTANVELLLKMQPADENGIIDTSIHEIELKPGSSSYKFALSAGRPQLWSPDRPFLYQTDIVCRWIEKKDPEFWDAHTVKSGFRSLVIDEDGFFCLNGERFFMKSAMIIPTWQEFPKVSLRLERFYKDVASLKSCGFNTIRFISVAATPMQLDICDKLGMMVHEEHRGAWQVKVTDRTEPRFNKQAQAIVKRDRNHASLVIFCMLNETYCDATFDIAVRALKPLRALAPNLLFLLSSGRWDGELKYASASNPGSSNWDAWMGAEGNSEEKLPVDRLTGYMPGMGDLHYYPAIPYDRDVANVIQGMGAKGRAVFLSENGCGSLGNCINLARYVEGLGQENNDFYKGKFAWQAEDFVQIWKDWRLDTVYPTPEEVLRDTERLASRQRRLIFDMFRSNPKITGYSMTAFKCAGGSGIWEMSGECKPGMPEAMEAGWAPLRWCLFVYPSHVYAGEPFDISVHLANDGVLKAGNYPATVRIHGNGKTVWERKLQIEIAPDNKGNYPLSIPVLEETVCPEMSAGNYTLSAVLEKGGHAADEIKTFFVSEKALLPRLEGEFATINLPESVEVFLKSCGAQLTEWSADKAVSCVLVGSLDDMAQAEILASQAEKGANVIYLTSGLIADKETVRLPFENKGYLFSKRDWLFHKDSLLLPGESAGGLLHSTIMDPEYYTNVLSFDMFLDLPVPDMLHVASFICGGGISIYGDKATCGGFSLGTYKWGKGSITLNSLDILGQVGNPAADRLLANLCHMYMLKI